MAKITRLDGNVLAFASQALTNERTTFGTTDTGDDTLDGNVTADFFRGWGIVGPSDEPTREDFNALGFTLGQFIAYLHQVGVAEWNESQEFHSGSIVNRSGTIYVCLTDDHVSATPPESDSTNWKPLLNAGDVDYDNSDSGLLAENVKGAIDELDNDVSAIGDTYAEKTYVGGVTLVDNASATFTNSTNNISAIGIGVGVEVGDVIQVSGSTDNDTEFTVEVITDANNVIVNQAHAGGSTSKALVDETATVTVKLLCKWYLAPSGLGQGWVDVTANRSFSDTPYINPFPRMLVISIMAEDTASQSAIIEVTNGGLSSLWNLSQVGSNLRYTPEISIEPSSVYFATIDSVSASAWYELR